MKQILLLILLLIFLVPCGVAHALVMTFDDFSGVSQDNYGPFDSYYHGFQFNSTLNWIDTVGSNWGTQGAVSGEFTVINNYGGSGVISTTDGSEFTFDGIYLKDWYGNATTGEIIGKNSGSVVFSKTININSVWTYYSGVNALVDSIEINPNTGNFLMDDLAVNENSQPVPEPATMLLLGTGLVGIAAVGRKKFFRK